MRQGQGGRANRCNAAAAATWPRHASCAANLHKAVVLASYFKLFDKLLAKIVHVRPASNHLELLVRQGLRRPV